MNIKKRHNNKRIVVIILATLILLIGASAYYYISQSTQESLSSSQDSTNLNPATDEEKQAGDQKKRENLSQADISSNSAKNNVDSSTSSTPAVLSMRITASSQNDNVYQIRTLIEGVVGNGTCKATLTRGGQVVTKTAPTQALAQSSTCQGFDIPTSELSVGTWRVEISFSGDAATGSTDGTLEVK